jgi:4,5-DOPA dioxygenase extradiol
MTLPAVFVSHGAPTLVIEDSPTRRFLAGLGPTLGRPAAVVVLSAHWLTRGVTVGGAVRPETIHDFSGFPAGLYGIGYPAPGDPALAGQVVAALAAAGLEPTLESGRGLDHGVWVPLALMFPAADIPVVPVSVQPGGDARHHWRIGQALRPLRDQGVLILASGGISHNLRAYSDHRPGDPAPSWVREFTDWVATAVAGGDTAALLDFARQAPHAAANHPTTEHLLPFFAALGAGTPGAAGRRLFAAIEHGVLALDAYGFD